MLHYSDINYVHTTCVYCLEKRDSKIYNIHCLENVLKKLRHTVLYTLSGNLIKILDIYIF